MSDLQLGPDPAAFRQIPSGLFVLTTACDGARSGVLARWVQRCSNEPPMMMVAIPKGQPVVRVDRVIVLAGEQHALGPRRN